MQVITGKYRARKLKSPDSARPTLQRIKISLFSMLNFFDFENAIVLDLFAGSGALGIECLSRGASHATMVDQDKGAVKCIQDNLKNIDKKDYQVLNLDHMSALKKLRGTTAFDIVFLDPPYAGNLVISCIEIMDRYNLLNDGAIIVIETEKEKDLSLDLEGFSVIKDKTSGPARIIILQKD